MVKIKSLELLSKIPLLSVLISDFEFGWCGRFYYNITLLTQIIYCDGQVNDVQYQYIRGLLKKDYPVDQREMFRKIGYSPNQSNPDRIRRRTCLPHIFNSSDHAPVTVGPMTSLFCLSDISPKSLTHYPMSSWGSTFHSLLSQPPRAYILLKPCTRCLLRQVPHHSAPSPNIYSVKSGSLFIRIYFLEPLVIENTLINRF